MNKIYRVEHSNINDALGEEFTAAVICNYHFLNEVVITYWHDAGNMIAPKYAAAIMRVIPTTEPLQDRLSRKLGNVPLVNGCSTVTTDLENYTHA